MKLQYTLFYSILFYFFSNLLCYSQENFSNTLSKFVHNELESFSNCYGSPQAVYSNDGNFLYCTKKIKSQNSFIKGYGNVILKLNFIPPNQTVTKTGNTTNISTGLPGATVNIQGNKFDINIPITYPTCKILSFIEAPLAVFMIEDKKMNFYIFNLTENKSIGSVSLEPPYNFKPSDGSIFISGLRGKYCYIYQITKDDLLMLGSGIKIKGKKLDSILLSNKDKRLILEVLSSTKYGSGYSDWSLWTSHYSETYYYDLMKKSFFQRLNFFRWGWYKK